MHTREAHRRRLEWPVPPGVEVDGLEYADMPSDRERILTDEEVLEGLEPVHRVAGADPHDADVGLDAHDRHGERRPWHGIPRRRFEAPPEYLSRVLSEVSGGRLAATRLTALFERARFSPHEVDENMKASAIEAIESLQADLAAAELEEAAA